MRISESLWTLAPPRSRDRARLLSALLPSGRYSTRSGGTRAGDDHPFNAYRRYGVPVGLATDDPGVPRIDISHAYEYARATYGLSYTELKDLARAPPEHAFLDGDSLWPSGSARTGYRPVRACAGSQPGVAPPRPCRATRAARG